MLRNGWRMDWRRFTARAAVRTRLDNMLSVGDDGGDSGDSGRAKLCNGVIWWLRGKKKVHN